MSDIPTSQTLIFENDDGTEDWRVEIVSEYVNTVPEEVIASDSATTQVWKPHRSGPGWVAFRRAA